MRQRLKFIWFIFFPIFRIKSSPNIRIPLKVNVIAPKLVVYHPNTTGDFTLIDFSLAVANTRKYDSFVLRNVSSQVASYVVLGEIENEVKCIRVTCSIILLNRVMKLYKQTLGIPYRTSTVKSILFIMLLRSDRFRVVWIPWRASFLK